MAPSAPAPRWLAWTIRGVCWALLVGVALRIALWPDDVARRGRLYQIHLRAENAAASRALLAEFGLPAEWRGAGLRVSGGLRPGAAAPTIVAIRRDVSLSKGTTGYLEYVTLRTLALDAQGLPCAPVLRQICPLISGYNQTPNYYYLAASGNRRQLMAMTGHGPMHSPEHEFAAWRAAGDRWINVLRYQSNTALDPVLSPDGETIKAAGAVFRWNATRELYEEVPTSAPSGCRLLPLREDQGPWPAE